MRSGRTRWCLLLIALLLSVVICTDGQAVVIKLVTAPKLPGTSTLVVDQNPADYTPINTGFRYLIQEDNSFYVIPGQATPTAPWPDPSNTLGVNIHHSQAPVVCAGDTGMINGASFVDTSTGPCAGLIDTSINASTGRPNKYYIVSVVPWHAAPALYPQQQSNGPFYLNTGGYGMSARNFAGTDSSVTVIVTPFPVPTAQITVLVFQDNQPINAALDQPAEPGLAGFSILLTDIVGKMMQDAFGNPVGTTYQVQRDNTKCTTVLPNFPNNSFCPPVKTAYGSYNFIVDPATSAPLIDYQGNGSLTSCPTGDSSYDAANCTDPDTGAPLANGEAVIRFLAPDKYSIEILPPAADPNWLLTGTLEGTRGNDAWVRAAEPRFNIQLGQLNWLVFYGYVKNCDAFNGVPCAPLIPPAVPANTPRGTITGRVVYAHDLHPPLVPGLASGIPVPNCYVGLNNLSGNDEQIYTAPCNADSTFSINNLPPGLYQLAMWDKEINAIIDYRQVTIPAAGGTVALGDVAVYSWWGQLMGSVFYDATGSATLNSVQLPAGDSRGIANELVNIRFANGSLFAKQLTDANGNYFFTQVFPFQHWLVAETDPGVNNVENVGRWKSTGMTAIVDDGGFVTVPPGGCPPGVLQCPPNVNPNPYAQYGINPQLQPSNGGLPYRVQATEGGEEVLTQAVNLFADMTNVINWGKKPYAPGENGGIKGFISYATSRTQEDPSRALWQGWEPGVPRVEVDLYYATQDINGNWVPANCTPSTINGVNTLTACVPSANPQPVSVTYTDSWDDNNPSDCVAQANTPWSNPQLANANPLAIPPIPGIAIRNCAETFRTWNQTRPGVYDGTYAFSKYCNGTVAASYPPLKPVGLDANYNATYTGGPNITCNGSPTGFTDGLPIGNYIVKAVPPRGFKIMKYGDRNIEFGEPNAAFQSYAPPCVGAQYPVPAFHTLFPDWQVPTVYPAAIINPNGSIMSNWYCNGQYIFNPDGSINYGLNLNPDGTCNPVSAGPWAPSCDMKEVQVTTGSTNLVDFRIFTDVPLASRMWGWVSDDLHLDSNPYSPNGGMNLSPSNLPVGIRDWAGRWVWRGYTDQWGKFEGSIPSTYTIYTPNPLGMSAAMYTVVVNDPGPIVRGSELTGMPRVCDGTQPAGSTCITDPYFNPAYGQEVIRENWDFYAGTTTFIDTIVIPSSAILSRAPLDCGFVDHTPIIKSVDSSGSGPIVTAGTNALLQITSVGTVEAPNPSFNPNSPPSAPATCAPISQAPSGTNCPSIWRDHGFGATTGSVTFRPANYPTQPDVVVSGAQIGGWANLSINVQVPASLAAGNYELIVTRPDVAPNATVTLSSVVGVTVHVLPVSNPPQVVVVSPPSAFCDPYTDATKCLRIQPAINSAPNGAIISIKPGTYMENVIMYKPQTLQGWGAMSTILDGTNALSNFPGRDQWDVLFQGLVGATCSGTTPCISIAAGGTNDFVFEQGAGIMVSACDPSAGACSNDFSKTPSMIDGLTVNGATETGGGIYVNSFATGLQISNNEVVANQGSLSGGIRVGTPSVTNGNVYSNYHNENMKIMYNHVAQNGSLQTGGGGIAMYKGADNYQITRNLICGNFAINYGGGIEHFGLSPNGLIAKNVIVSNESFDQGGGIMLAGELPIAGATGIAATMTEGSGSVEVNDNLIQGNKGGDDGGGISTLLTNGQDVFNNPTNPRNWYALSFFNNMIVDNVSGDHGGGIALDDSVFVYAGQNTIARNDATSTGSGAFTSGVCTNDDPAGQLCPNPNVIENGGGGGLTNSIPRVGGIAAYAYSTVLAQAVASASGIPANLQTYSNPYLFNNIIFQNRSWYWNACANGAFGQLCYATNPPAANPCACNTTTPDYWDVAVYGATPTTVMTQVQHNIFTPTVNDHYTGAGNITLDPSFVSPYFNVFEATSKGAALGNFVNVFFTPIGLMSSSDVLYGDYHINAGSPAIALGETTVPNVLDPTTGTFLTETIASFTPWVDLTKDYDGQARSASSPDSGADTRAATELWFPW